jgi:2-dehydro-3-deoxy-D-gluconate 5-dehydrogenase
LTPTPLADLLNLTGKTAIITGGAKGIGYGISYRLAEAGAHVLIADLDTEAAQATAKELGDKGWSAQALSVDVSDENAVQDMVKHCQATFNSLDILINNAGIYPNQPIAAMTKADFERVVNVNLRSVFLTTKYASQVMKQSGQGGRIINITSIDALHPSMVGLAHYDASKHGLWGFTKNSALELAPHNIWVNAIAPGGIITPGVQALQKGQKMPAEGNPQDVIETFLSKIPMHRFGDPDEIGKVALFLASDLASYMTGSQIVVDGGVLLS